MIFCINCDYKEKCKFKEVNGWCLGVILKDGKLKACKLKNENSLFY